MAKRTASNELNHTNWDDDDEPEDAGSFKRASEEVIKQRVIKSARRRNPIRESEESKPNIFGGFTGFGKTSTPSTAALQNLTNIVVPKTNGTSSTSENKTGSSNNEEYLAKLKGLNESVLDWIKSHVEKNPYINLTPVFDDYSKYIKTIELTEDKNAGASNTNKDLASFAFKAPTVSSSSANDTQPTFKLAATTEEKTNSTFSFTNATPQAKTNTAFTFGNQAKTEEKTNSTFTFGKPIASSDSPSKNETPAFKFGAPTSTTSLFSNSTTSTAFTMGSTPSLPTFGSTNSGLKLSFNAGSTPFTFSNTSAPTSETTNKPEGGEDDEDAPPKVEFKQVEEDGHVYKIKCKVFVKKDSSYSDRGVGMLYLKPVQDSEKTQLIVRADTNLGNLLCNFILSKSLPSQRMGKKDVMIVCIPTPDCKPPPVAVLLRVKSPEEADKLLETLENHKK